MCRIFVAALKSGRAGPLLFSGLKKLEYGGYDSSGIATIYKGKILTRKGVGKLDEIDRMVKLRVLPGKIGIAHNRWATHGAPTENNAHPHLDCERIIALVHNGIIENFWKLKAELADKGHKFVSRTDTEVVAHLIEEFMKKGMKFVEACMAAQKELAGSYAIAAICSKEPDKVVLMRKDSPLILGIGRDGNYASSDPVAFIEFTKRMIPLENEEMAVITPASYEILRGSKQVRRRAITITWSLEEAQKGGFPHFMLKEMFEQPQALRYALNLQEVYLNLVTELMDRAKTVYLVGAGTSYHSCLAGSYLYSKLATLPSIPSLASEFMEQYGRAINVDSAILFVTQSGETADVLNAAEQARLRAATILAITNVLGSSITRVARAYLLQQSGPEIGVAATKTYTSQLLVHLQLALALAKKRGKISQAEMDELKDELRALPELIEKVLKLHNKRMQELAKKYLKKRHFFFLGRGLNHATALEGRLKLLEISYVPATAYPAGESKHGPIALIDEGFPVIFIAPKDSTRKTIIGNIMEMKARGARIIVLGEEGDEELESLSDDFIPMPPMHELFTPIAYVVPLQLFAYHMAVIKGVDPDKPRNLAKSVTVL
jgi:glucosamine--fructose-6-phosphate aminotransferase (isomerizing)